MIEGEQEDIVRSMSITDDGKISVRGRTEEEMQNIDTIMLLLQERV